MECWRCSAAITLWGSGRTWNGNRGRHCIEDVERPGRGCSNRRSWDDLNVPIGHMDSVASSFQRTVKNEFSNDGSVEFGMFVTDPLEILQCFRLDAVAAETKGTQS